MKTTLQINHISIKLTNKDCQASSHQRGNSSIKNSESNTIRGPRSEVGNLFKLQKSWDWRFLSECHGLCSSSGDLQGTEERAVSIPPLLAASSPLPGGLPWELCSKKAEISLKPPWTTVTSGHGPLILLFLEFQLKRCPFGGCWAGSLYLLILLKYSWFYSAVFMSAVQQSDPVRHILTFKFYFSFIYGCTGSLLWGTGFL